MTSSKHFKELPPGIPKPPNDLERNPGIGQSRGTSIAGEDPDIIAADSTVEGDVGNGTNADGGISTSDEARTNK